MIDFHRFFCAGTGYATFQSFVAAPMLRHAFRLGAVPETALLTICAPGFYELYVNGERVTKGRLSPYVANPDEFLCCDSYDIAGQLAVGENVIGIVLGNGVINNIGGSVWDFDLAYYRAEPCFALDARIGDTVFDASVFVTKPSAIIFNDMRAGEWYDARLETKGWLQSGFDDSDWEKVLPSMAPRGQKRDMAGVPPVLPEKEIKAVSYRKSRVSIPPEWRCPRAEDVVTPPDEAGEGILYDFGENTSGVCRLTLRSPGKGRKIILQYGEILGDMRPDGSGLCDRTEKSGLDLRSYMFLPERFDHRDVYITRGDETEVWEPMFTCHGFRYCLAIGLDEAEARDDTLTAVVLHTQMERRADFSCSDETANSLWEAGIRSDLSNLCHIPMDCPHRERNGWTGDAALSAEQMLTVLTSKDMLTEWLAHVRRSMLEDGNIPGIVPTSGWGYSFGPCWDAALTEIPYRIFTIYADDRPARESAPVLLRYLHFLSGHRDENGLICFGLGDWCQSARSKVDRPTTPEAFTSTVTAYDSCRKAACLFRHLKQAEEAAYADSLAASLKEAVRRELMDIPGGTVLCRAQTGQAMAIYYDIFEPCEKALAVEKLVQMIHLNNDRFDCGILGLRVIFRVLGDAGKADLAWKMLTGPAFPSYGYWIAHGATSLWEQFTPIESMQSSCNHHFTGDILCFFLMYAAGLRYCPAEEGKDMIIRPEFINSLTWAKGSIDTPRGRTAVSWKREDGGISLQVTLPRGVNARVILGADMKTEDGFSSIKLKQSACLKLIMAEAPDNMRLFPEC